MDHTHDLIIIGSGSGNSIPEYLADHRIAIVERGVFGGTCLNVGCIPSKMFVVPADLALAADGGPRLGIDTSFDGADWKAIRDRVFGRIDPIAAGGREYRATGSANVELIEGTARFTGPTTLDVDGRSIAAPKILVAAGSRPVIPPGLDGIRYHTSDTIMRLDEQPARLGILGGGYIAVEMGHVFSALGTEVTLLSRSAPLVRHEDHDVAQRFTEVFGRRISLRLGHVPERYEQRDGPIVVVYEGEEIEVDELLVAIGRDPNSDLIDAEAAGLPLTTGGQLVVDDMMATPVPGIWAIGDIANPYQLKHLANAEAKVAFWNIAHPDDPKRVDYRSVPHAIFGNPQIAGVGLTEDEARGEGFDIVVGRRDYGGTAYGWALEDTESFAKVLVDRSTHTIVGAHILGPQASTLIQPLIQAMHFSQPIDEIATDVFYIHPALSEVVENALLDALDQLSSSPS